MATVEPEEHFPLHPLTLLVCSTDWKNLIVAVMVMIVVF
jgi:hypothetical protein